MAEVRPDEVSAILRQQLASFKSDSELEQVGTVLQVGDGIARIYGLTKVQSGGELIEFKNGLRGIVLNLEEDNVGAVLLGQSNDIREGDIVKRTGKIASSMWVKVWLDVLLIHSEIRSTVKVLFQVNCWKCHSSVKLRCNLPSAC